MTTFAFDDIPDQAGRTALVTGANTGIGFHIARELAARGGRVLLAARERDKGEEARARIVADFPQADVTFLPLDLADIASVREAARIARQEPRLDLLIENAGVMMPPLGHATAGTEQQFAVNHLGHFALAALLLDKLGEGEDPRVVVQSSLAHRRGEIRFDNLDASQGYSKGDFYAQSKLANLLFAFELDRRLRAIGSPIKAIGCHPGVAATELMRHLGPLAKPGLMVVNTVLNDARHGALPALQAATDPQASGGDYFGPYGLFEMSGKRSGPAFAVPRARDDARAHQLWQRSEELTGVEAGLAPA